MPLPFTLPAALPAAPITSGGGGGGGSSPTPAVAVTIAGAPVVLLGTSDNPNVSASIGQRSTAKVTVRDDSGTARYQQGSAISCYDASGALIFGGVVLTDTITKPAWGASLLLHQLDCSDWHYLADKRIVATSYGAGTTCGAAVRDLITNWLASEGITAGTIQDGPALAGSLAINYKSATTAIDQLAQLAGFIWWIDAYKRLNFLAPATNAAPWTLDGTQIDDGGNQSQMSLELTNPLYRNGEWVLGHKEVTSTQTETRKGDGNTRAWAMAYPMHAAPSSITVNGVSQTIGPKTPGTGKQFYYAVGDAVITQDSGQTVLASTDTLVVTYVGEYNAVAYSQDDQAVAAQAALEGGGSSGLVEDVQTNTALTTNAQAFQFAAALLAKYATSGEILKFTTRTTGLQPGQLLTVALPAPWSLTGVYLIQDVAPRFDGLSVWWYDVSALAGPVNDTWVQFFTRLTTAQSAADNTSAGTQEQVAILAQFTAAWNWAATYTATVLACPIPGPTQYPSATLYPC